jgi:hypothetical protein
MFEPAFTAQAYTSYAFGLPAWSANAWPLYQRAYKLTHMQNDRSYSHIVRLQNFMKTISGNGLVEIV